MTWFDTDPSKITTTNLLLPVLHNFIVFFDSIHHPNFSFIIAERNLIWRQGSFMKLAGSYLMVMKPVFQLQCGTASTSSESWKMPIVWRRRKLPTTLSTSCNLLSPHLALGPLVQNVQYARHWESGKLFYAIFTYGSSKIHYNQNLLKTININ